MDSLSTPVSSITTLGRACSSAQGMFRIVELGTKDDKTGRMSSLERAKEILDAFTPESPNLSLTGLVSATRLPKTTVHRTAHALVDLGYLEKDERGRYVIGLRVFEVGTLAPRAYRYRDRIVPHLERLFAVTGTDVMLAVRDGQEAVLVEQFIARSSAPLAAGLGERLPLHASAAGLVMLAFGPRDLLSAVCKSGLVRYTADTLVDERRLRAAVAEVRSTRTSVVHNGMVEGAVSIGAPILDPASNLIASLLIVVPVGSPDIERLRYLAQRTARDVSFDLAGSHHDTSRVVRRDHP